MKFRYLFCLALILGQPLLYGLTIVSSPSVISESGTNINRQLAVSTTGKAIAIWVQNLNVVQSAYFNGTTWDPAISLDATVSPEVGIDGNGNATAIWLDSSISTPQIYTARFSASSGTWDTPIQQSTTVVNAAPRIAVNTSGNALAVWTSTNPQQIIATTYNVISGLWETPSTLVTGINSYPLIALDDLNQGIITYVDGDFAIESILVSVP